MSYRLYGRSRLLNLVQDSENFTLNSDRIISLGISDDNQYIHIFGSPEHQQNLHVPIVQFFVLPPRIIFLHSPTSLIDEEISVLVCFDASSDLNDFLTALKLCQSLKPLAEISKNQSESKSVFDARTESASASQYFQFYGYLYQQQNMMQDYVRTSTYQRAIHANAIDFKDKVVLDVGAGSGILSFFAVQAGARRVYAVEASSVAICCAELVRTNNLSDKIHVINGRVEEISLPEEVDIVISEPMGYMLVNERMLESYIHGRKFLKPGGRMFPSVGHLHIALFSDEALYIEQYSRGNFWCQESFHGVNLSGVRPQAIVEIFKQPIVDTWPVNSLVSGSIKWTIDFEKDDESKLHRIAIPFQFTATRNGFVHGIASWFDVAFIGSSETVWLSTCPTEPLTHWYQVRCLLDKPLIVFAGQVVTGHLLMIANDKQSYDIQLSASTGPATGQNSLDLKNPFFRYAAATVVYPTNVINESPSDALLQQNGGPVTTMTAISTGEYPLETIMDGPSLENDYIAGVPITPNCIYQNIRSSNSVDLLPHPSSQLLPSEEVRIGL